MIGGGGGGWRWISCWVVELRLVGFSFFLSIRTVDFVGILIERQMMQLRTPFTPPISIMTFSLRKSIPCQLEFISPRRADPFIRVPSVSKVISSLQFDLILNYYVSEIIPYDNLWSFEQYLEKPLDRRRILSDKNVRLSDYERTGGEL